MNSFQFVCETNHISHTGVVIVDSEAVVNIPTVRQSQFFNPTKIYYLTLQVQKHNQC